MRSVAGRVQPDGGSLRILGLPPSDDAARSARGWVPQEIALYPLLSPRENLWTFGRYQGLAGDALTKAIGESLDWIGLADRGNDKTDSLSGRHAPAPEHRRRHDPRAPRACCWTSRRWAWTPSRASASTRMIAELKSRGVSLLYTTHYMEEAERLCDRIAIIDHGKIIASGTKDELVRQTVGTRQALMVEADAPIPPALKAKLEAAGAAVEGMQARFSVANPAEEIRQVLALFHDAGIGVRDLTLKSPTLEQVFLQLTGRELRE